MEGRLSGAGMKRGSDFLSVGTSMGEDAGFVKGQHTAVLHDQAAADDDRVDVARP
jgi:hypothetical protein